MTAINYYLIAVIILSILLQKDAYFYMFILLVVSGMGIIKKYGDNIKADLKKEKSQIDAKIATDNKIEKMTVENYELKRENKDLKKSQEKILVENYELKVENNELKKIKKDTVIPNITVELYDSKIILDEIKELSAGSVKDVSIDNIIINEIIRNEIMKIDKKYYSIAFTNYFNTVPNRDAEFKRLRSLYHKNLYRNDTYRKNKQWAENRGLELDGIGKKLGLIEK